MAFLTLFRVATGDNWNGIMKDTLREDCDQSDDCLHNCCVSAIIAPVFFVAFVLMAQFVLVNVVVAVLMKHLEESHKKLTQETEHTSEGKSEQQSAEPCDIIVTAASDQETTVCTDTSLRAEDMIGSGGEPGHSDAGYICGGKVNKSKLGAGHSSDTIESAESSSANLVFYSWPLSRNRSQQHASKTDFFSSTPPNLKPSMQVPIFSGCRQVSVDRATGQQHAVSLDDFLGNKACAREMLDCSGGNLWFLTKPPISSSNKTKCFREVPRKLRSRLHILSYCPSHSSLFQPVHLFRKRSRDETLTAQLFPQQTEAAFSKAAAFPGQQESEQNYPASLSQTLEVPGDETKHRLSHLSLTSTQGRQTKPQTTLQIVDRRATYKVRQCSRSDSQLDNLSDSSVRETRPGEASTASLRSAGSFASVPLYDCEQNLILGEICNEKNSSKFCDISTDGRQRDSAKCVPTNILDDSVNSVLWKSSPALCSSGPRGKSAMVTTMQQDQVTNAVSHELASSGSVLPSYLRVSSDLSSPVDANNIHSASCSDHTIAAEPMSKLL